MYSTTYLIVCFSTISFRGEIILVIVDTTAAPALYIVGQ